MRVLITGSAGFIGSELCCKLLTRGDFVLGVDNHNEYYDPNLKEARLSRHIEHTNYEHHRVDIEDHDGLNSLFANFKPERVVNLAAQAGVRYSIDNPSSYIKSNLTGFANILECCRHHRVRHLVYASSSSVYGSNTNMPYSTHHNVDHPLSLYAATKKSNELMAHAYSNLFQLPTTGLRFFTVYGPWGRPDMALFKFTRAILSGEAIKVYNYGNHRRDFTYIDDIVSGLVHVLDRIPIPNADWDSESPDPASSKSPWRIYNIGNSSPVPLLDFIGALEEALNLKASLDLLPLQPGDVPDTFADVKDLELEYGYKPETSINQGVSNFVNWYRSYYGERV
jgi:UDP-glucuronate 4-epimerase